MLRRKILAVTAALAVLYGTGADAADKNWSPPTHKIYAQQLSDEIMAAHPELLSVTFHGVPPGMTDTYTMFAGSYPERIGNPDDPDDIDVSKKGITIVDPRWHRSADPSPKFVILEPLRDRDGANIGLIVFAFRVPTESNAGERYFYSAALDLRDQVATKIASYDTLFAPAK